MCEKCARYVRNVGGVTTVKPGLIRFLAHYSITHEMACVPVFKETAANLAVEAEVHRIRTSRTDCSHYTRKGRRTWNKIVYR